ncbi:MAG: Ig-like domain-containing protein [bacterium]
MRPGAAGIYVAAPIWNSFMQKAYKIKSESNNSEQEEIENQFNLPKNIEYFNTPDPSPATNKPMLNGQIAQQQKVSINIETGKLATGSTPIGLLHEKIYKQVHSILYYVEKNNPLGDYPNDPNQDSQFWNWEKEVIKWANSQPCSNDICYNQNPPTEYDDNNPENQKLEVKIISPQENDLITESILNIQAQAQSSIGIKQLDFFFNNQLIGTDTTIPYSITFNMSSYNIESSNQTIKVRAYDKSLNKKEDEINIIYKQ